ncbi:MAG: hypothetical protein WED10_10290 [Brumimicrobium sp.]
MKNLILPLLLAGSLFLYSCGKDPADAYPEYLGEWDSESDGGFSSISINDGISTYQGYDGSMVKTATGKARIKGKEKKLKIGIKGFKIDTPPYAETVSGSSYEQHYMVLDGVKYHKW